MELPPPHSRLLGKVRVIKLSPAHDVVRALSGGTIPNIPRIPTESSPEEQTLLLSPLSKAPKRPPPIHRPPIFDLGEVRANEIRRLLLDRYGYELPEDDAGREDLVQMLRHYAHLQGGDQRMTNYIEVYAPWLSKAEGEPLKEAAAREPPPRLTADELAGELGVTISERTRLGFKTIGAIDCDKEQREQRRRAIAKLRQAARRRSLGKKTRAEFLEASLSRLKLWEAEGISRSTWYRRRKLK
jgi:hypothetical protein